MLFHRMTLGSMTVNCYIAADEETRAAVLFDAPDEAEKIIEYLDENGLKLRTVFLTHAHFDHMGALDSLIRATGAKLALHEADVKYLNNPSLNLSGMMGISFSEFHADFTVSHGDVIREDGISIRVIHTPGHTEGSVCYLLGDILVSGDTLFHHSVGRADFPLGSFDDEIKYIKERLMVLDDCVKVYPGHGFSTTIGRERKENPYLL